MKIKVGTRASALAMWQTNHVIELLKKRYPEIEFEVITVMTKGDKQQNIALNQLNDKGLFVKEIEMELLEGNIDMAVHSMKDMPSEWPKGLCFAKTLDREDPRDVLVLRSEKELKDGMVIGCGSIRRSVQLKKLADVTVRDIRGNVDTRLRKLDSGDYDGIVLAAAGLKRLGLENRITHIFDVHEMIPACAQGALAIELREENHELKALIEACADEEIDVCVQAERYFLKMMDGSCHVAVGALCQKTDSGYVFHAIYQDQIYEQKGTDLEALVKDAVNVFGRF